MDLHTHLLTDDDWSELLIAEYQASGHRVDELTRARIWKKTEQALGALPEGSRSPLAGPLAMAALLLIGILSFVNKGLMHPTAGIKGAGEAYTGQLVSLIVYQMGAGGVLEPFYPSDARAGRTLVFRTLAPEDGVVALLMAEGDGEPVVRFVGSPSRGGSEQLLERGGRAYGFTLAAGQTAPLRFCVVAEGSQARLQALLQDPAELWPMIEAESPGACVEVSVPGGR